jgi:RNA polymerase sigma-70 factor (ECF subfamily)
MVETSTATPLQREPAPLTPDQRQQLWRVFRAWTGNATVADDLTQETLIEAWRSSRRPGSEPDLTRWLFGVARNVLRRYRQEQGRQARWHLDLPDEDRAFAFASESLDLDADLERGDIVGLLDAALARIPAESRRALLLRYVDDLPQAEIAARLGLNEKALEGKLHRGKRAMHRYLVTDGQEQARALGLLGSDDDWQVTNLWCDGCGRQRLIGKWTDDGGLRLDCPSCDLLGGHRSHHTDASGPMVEGLRSFGAATRRLAIDLHRETRHGFADPGPCPNCGRTMDLIRFETDRPSLFEFWLRCSGCGTIQYRSSVGITGSHPSCQRWLKQERRGAFDPSTANVERDGREAVILRWDSLTSGSTWEAIRDRETLAYMSIMIDGRPIPIDESGDDNTIAPK